MEANKIENTVNHKHQEAQYYFGNPLYIQSYRTVLFWKYIIHTECVQAISYLTVYFGKQLSTMHYKA